MANVTAPPDGPLSAEQRSAILAQQIAAQAMQGWRVESRSEFQAVLVKGQPVNHILHLLISVFTLGLWLPVWIFLSVFAGQRRRMLVIDEYGR